MNCDAVLMKLKTVAPQGEQVFLITFFTKKVMPRGERHYKSTRRSSYETVSN